MLTLHDLSEVPASRTLAWLEALSNNLRPADIAEVEASSGLDPQTSLIHSVQASTMAWIGMWDGAPIMVFGAAPIFLGDTLLDAVAQAWLMGSPVMDERHTAFSILRETLPYLRQMHARYPTLFNYIDARNVKSMRWLEWAGFHIQSADPEHGREKRLFYRFARYDPCSPADHQHPS